MRSSVSMVVCFVGVALGAPACGGGDGDGSGGGADAGSAGGTSAGGAPSSGGGTSHPAAGGAPAGGTGAASGGAPAGAGGTLSGGGTGGSAPVGTKSGLDPSRQMSDLNASEIQQLCNWALHQPGIGQEKDCGGGLSVTVDGPSAEECKSTTTCPATVGDVENCYAALVANACDFAIPAACDPLVACTPP